MASCNELFACNNQCKYNSPAFDQLVLLLKYCTLFWKIYNSNLTIYQFLGIFLKQNYIWCLFLKKIRYAVSPVTQEFISVKIWKKIYIEIIKI